MYRNFDGGGLEEDFKLNNSVTHESQLASLLVDSKQIQFINTRIPVLIYPYTYGERCNSMQIEIINSWIPYKSRVPLRYDERRQSIGMINQFNFLKGSIIIKAVLAINPQKDNSFEKLVIWYDVDGLPSKGTVSFREFSEYKFVDTLIGVKARKGMKMQANEYLYDLICGTQWLFVAIPIFPCWKRIPVKSDNWIWEKMLFFTNDSVGPFLLEYASEAIKMRSCKTIQNPPKHIYFYCNYSVLPKLPQS